MTPVLVVWAPEVPPRPPLVRLQQPVILYTLALYKLGTHFTAPGTLGDGVMEKNTCTAEDCWGDRCTTTSVVDWCPKH